MPSEFHVHQLPASVSRRQLTGKTVVVIDVLRATTTIVHALAAGAVEVKACLEVDEARELAVSLGRDQVVLGGEREGLPISGFDLGNSPREYRTEIVGGKIVVFTSTNGTRAIEHCREAGRVLLGAFVNLSAVCKVLQSEDAVHILCAGTKNRVTSEDVLLAGAIGDRLVDGRTELNDQADLAIGAWRSVAREMDAIPLSRRLRNSRGGRNLRRTNQDGDIEIAAEIDKFNLVPQLDVEQLTIRER
ncbi:MAG: 2-phosphosulfolactate phosphatase [Pirellulales bacterium]